MALTTHEADNVLSMASPSLYHAHFGRIISSNVLSFGAKSDYGNWPSMDIVGSFVGPGSMWSGRESYTGALWDNLGFRREVCGMAGNHKIVHIYTGALWDNSVLGGKCVVLRKFSYHLQGP